METGVIVAIIAAAASIIGGIVSGAFALILDKVKHKEAREDRAEELRDEWRQRLDKDEKSIDGLKDAATEARDMDKMLLRGLMLITAHLVDRNHTKELIEYSEEVNQKLIERL